MTQGKRRYLLALVSGRLCCWCKSAPAAQDWHTNECGPCAVKRIDREEMMGGR